MSDIVERLRGVDHQSIEDCFLQSPLFSHAANEIERLRTLLSEAEQKLQNAKKIAMNAESYGYGHGLEAAAQLAKKMQDDALTDSAREHAGHFEEAIREIQSARDLRAVKSEAAT